MPDTAVWNPQYHQIVLATDPIAYWLQDEKQRNVSYDWVRRRQGSDQDGAYTGVTLYEPGIGDGRASPFFDGANDFNNVFTATLQGRFDGDEGTVMARARVFNAGVWTDGAFRAIVWFQRVGGGGTELAQVLKTNVVGRLQYAYRAGGVLETINFNSPSPTAWFQVALTWSVSAGPTGEVRAFFNGAQVGATQVGLGVWGGNPDLTVIGADTLVPTSVWHGNIAHAAVWDRPLTPAEILYLYEQGVF